MNFKLRGLHLTHLSQVPCHSEGPSKGDVLKAGIKDFGVMTAGIKDFGVMKAGIKDFGVMQAGIKDFGVMIPLPTLGKAA
ncbi:hypothetical protein [Deinococcus planocerae]|uniref:hypothetical protein n=1 Tax=Deinococcus planocerae TaxID=1737569 RepID=UPI0011AF35DA|nr:hypothetical protein [Deinococcus planocerae]